LIGIVGFFPMTTFVSSYIQPDNLTFTLVALSTFCALRLRRATDHIGLLAILGLALGVLLVTKWHIYLCLAPWLVAAAIMARRHRARLRGTLVAMLLALPSLALGIVQLWVSWGAPIRSYTATGSARPIFGPLVSALHGGPLSLIAYSGRELASAFADFFIYGQVTSSFWGRFGYDDTPLVFGPPKVDALVQLLRLTLVLVVLALFLSSRRRIGVRLIAVARRGRRSTALRLAMSDPLLNASLTFTVFMFGLYIATDNLVAAQGRNWLPFLLPLFLVPLRYAPRAFRVRGARRLMSRGLAVGLAVYCLGGGVFAVQAVHDRYYGTAVAARPVVPLTCTPLPPAVALAAARR
jgi:4-amino-4-deoxy-L-arabinose transferase-like glycosyltransferase